MVITGGDGFIGTNFIERHGGISYDLVNGQDVRDFDQLCQYLSGQDVLIHLAASPGVPQSIDDPGNDFSHNVIGTWRALEAARQTGIQRVIFASSGSVQNARSPYAAGKASGEAYMMAYRESYGMSTLSLRFSNVYGPYSEDKTSVVASMIKSPEIIVKGDGYQTRDFIHVFDVVDAIASCVDSDYTGVLNIATGIQTSINQVAYSIAKKMKKEVRHDAPSKGDVRSNPVDITRAKCNLGWEPEIGLWDGLDNTVDWFKEYKYAS